MARRPNHPATAPEAASTCLLYQCACWEGKCKTGSTASFSPGSVLRGRQARRVTRSGGHHHTGPIPVHVPLPIVGVTPRMMFFSLIYPSSVCPPLPHPLLCHMCVSVRSIIPSPCSSACARVVGKKRRLYCLLRPGYILASAQIDPTADDGSNREAPLRHRAQAHIE